MRALFLLLVLSICLLFAAGCQDTGLAVMPVRAGAATLSIRWPSPTRLLPEATASLHLVIRQGERIVVEEDVARPAGEERSTVTFTNLPLGDLSISATALADPTLGSAPLASGTAPLVIYAEETTQVRLSLDSTIATLAIDPPAPTLTVGETARLTVTAYDAQGQMVLLTATALTWSSTSDAVADIAAGVVTGHAAGSAVITVTDGESGVSGAATVLVTAMARAEHIVFCSSRDGNQELYRLNPDGSGLARLTETPGEEGSPTISPDGACIAYDYRIMNATTNSSTIRVMQADGTGTRSLTAGPNDRMPAWSADGAKLAYIAADNHLMVVNADGSAPSEVALPFAPSYLFTPCWLPDGQSLIVVAQRSGDVQNLYQVWLDGSKTVPLTPYTLAGRMNGVSLSRQGMIAYHYIDTTTNARGMYVLELATGTILPWTVHANDRYPCWSPDGTRLVVMAMEEGAQYDLVIVNPDGSRQRLTRDAGHDIMPAWGVRP